jgi:hypothetical protein
VVVVVVVVAGCLLLLMILSVLILMLRQHLLHFWLDTVDPNTSIHDERDAIVIDAAIQTHAKWLMMDASSHTHCVVGRGLFGQNKDIDGHY